MLLIALTGGIGAGKSSASAELLKRNPTKTQQSRAVLVDADAVAKELQASTGKAFAPMVELFGDHVVGPDGELDRPAIAAVVFNDKDILGKLNALMFPLIGATILERIEENRETDNVVLLDIPLLGMSTTNNYNASAMIVVDCPVDIALDRLVNGPRKMKREDAQARMANQITREERLALADFVIDNSGTPDDLALAVDECWTWIETLRTPSPTGAI